PASGPASGPAPNPSGPQFAGTSAEDRLADLLSRIGNRIGFENLARYLPAESHIPERAFTVAAAAWSDPGDWRAARSPGAPPRPITLFAPEPVFAEPEAPSPVTQAPGAPAPGTPAPGAPAPDNARPAGTRLPPPARFRWRGRSLTLAAAEGPERLAPEWWWDDPAWAAGVRDYWRIATAEGPRLWLFHTPASPAGPAWHVHGAFA
ncbi:MAG: hypothetical protein AAFR52_19745, partial [Pseudomonadota bacterium]